MDRQVGIRELRDGAAALVRRVEGGEVVTVTRRGQPVARLVPVNRPPAVRRMLEAGRLRWSGRTAAAPEPVALRGEGPLASDYVSEGRR